MVSHYELGQGHSWRPCQGPLPQVAVSLAGGGLFRPLRVVACAAGCSSVRVVPRTADVKLSRSMALRLCFYCRRAKLVFLETNRHIPMTIRHTQNQSNF